MIMTPGLRAIVEEAYKVFAVPVPVSTGVCKNCCMDPTIERDFLKTPIRDMPEEYLSDWYFAALTDMTRGVAAYVLPRVFELIARGIWPNRTSDEITLNFLPEAGYPQEWDETERRIVQAFLVALLDQTLQEDHFDNGPGLDALLCMASNANADVAGLLDHLDQMNEGSFARALAFDLSSIGGLDSYGELVNAFWQTAPGLHRQIVEAWYKRPELVARMERAFFNEPDPDRQRKISDAIEVVRTWTDAQGPDNDAPATPDPLDRAPPSS